MPVYMQLACQAVKNQQRDKIWLKNDSKSKLECLFWVLKNV